MSKKDKFTGYTFADYMQSVIDNTIECENKNPIFFYFGYDRETIENNIQHFEECYNWNINPIYALNSLYLYMGNPEEVKYWNMSRVRYEECAREV